MAKILLVDDELAILQSTRLMLQDFGHEVVTETDAREILPRLRRDKFDVLIQDIRMPGLDILSLVDRVRQDIHLHGLRILLFSASLSLEAISRATGADGMVEKPFQPQELREAVGRAMASAAGA